MSEILKSKGMIVFFLFVIVMGILTTSSFNSMKNDDIRNNEVVLDNIYE